jgi:hypothetical protein
MGEAVRRLESDVTPEPPASEVASGHVAPMPTHDPRKALSNRTAAKRLFGVGLLDRGLLKPVVTAYANANELSYEDGHRILSRILNSKNGPVFGPCPHCAKGIITFEKEHQTGHDYTVVARCDCLVGQNNPRAKRLRPYTRYYPITTARCGQGVTNPKTHKPKSNPASERPAPPASRPATPPEALPPVPATTVQQDLDTMFDDGKGESYEPDEDKRVTA